MALARKSSNSKRKIWTNSPDWSALVPVLPDAGPRTAALYGAIRRLIETGAVPPGGKLPPTRDLAARLKVSRASVVAAFEMLTADGFAEARVGAGTFVAERVPHLRPSSENGARTAESALPLPGTLGVAVSDPRTLGTFRKLLSWHLARPVPAHFHYGDPLGSLELREAIASYLRSARGVRCDAASIVITSGTQQGLDLIIRTALRPGDGVWLEDPCYPSARLAFTGAGMRIAGVPVDAEGLDAELGRNLMPRARAVYVTPSHQFPLGVTMSMRRRLALIEWARDNAAWIIEDDYDSEFRFAGAPLTAMQGLDGSDRVIYLGTFSKVLFPGLRLGYAVIPEPLLSQVVALRMRTDRYPPTLAEGAMTDLLREGHFAAHLRRARRRTEAARDGLVEGLRSGTRSAALEVIVPDQGLHLVARLKVPTSDVEAAATAATAGLGARALSSMYVSHPPQQGLVIGFSGFSPEEFRLAASRFACLL
ncbi:PLP-dependent aminotransferase family protein [Sinorhizobium sp. BG8]|uniref:MocR-like pyridoxine biosynthesis transcription factor PdxR n=1 Tax=Sinorhizobium sp. BG8 TaxID=2613773 RepID=UPI00193D4E32|nr:PLP-dependent aminotransferase family protein [Sinorhizobium sp. BG8]QRM56222.1 PLP-dependent aminotransferase family protein [Sinorhizobium sp. BG8]